MVARSERRLRRPATAGGPRLTRGDAAGPDAEGGSRGGSGRPDGRNARPSLGQESRPGTVLQGGRRKAYRPLPAEKRREALDAALAAYEGGDYFEAHELLEPAWMGTDDELERELYQGLIKLAAGGVHQVRGNPRGVANNLLGARQRLARVAEAAAPDAGLDLRALLLSIDEALRRVDRVVAPPPRPPGSPRFGHRAPVDVEPPRLVRRAAT